MDTTPLQHRYPRVRGIDAAMQLAEMVWGVQPWATLACIGGSDQHWQVWHPEDLRPDGMPSILVDCDGRIEAHPDGRPI